MYMYTCKCMRISNFTFTYIFALLVLLLAVKKVLNLMYFGNLIFALINYAYTSEMQLNVVSLCIHIHISKNISIYRG